MTIDTIVAVLAIALVVIFVNGFQKLNKNTLFLISGARVLTLPVEATLAGLCCYGLRFSQQG